MVGVPRRAASKYAPCDRRDESCKLGPVISGESRDRISRTVERALSQRATLLTGGPERPRQPSDGYYVNATILGAPEAVVAQEEIFGPVLSVIPYDSEREALQILNLSRYGLAAAVWARDEERAYRFARNLRVGQVDINGGRFNPAAPFGGFKESGYGRELGRAGVSEYLTTQAIQR